MWSYSYGYHGLGAFGLLWLVIYAALVIVPFWRLLPRFGMPNWVSLVSVIPLGALILLWIMAFKDKGDGGRG
ncbi:NADH dehydrogenase subunit C [Defluviimonas sp. 20V17]|nr:NADH dehydrogenase subunit C [Defluviimonas sp. 20V17]